MEKGLSGQASCLAMIPSYIHVPSNAPKNENIIVIDAGGTNFRTALIRFDHESNPHTEYFSKTPMPGIEKELTREEFFNQIIDYIKPVLGKSNRLGFCFSYAFSIDRERDGTLLYWTKEIKAQEVVGEKILANLSKTLRQRNLPCPENMIIMNDTVASLLAGVSATNFSSEYDFIGFILGTGTNTSYIEANNNIKKEKNLLPEGSQIINVETGNFNKFLRSDIDEAFDKTTANSGTHVLEKMISGAYLGSLCYTILKTAATEGVISQLSMEVLEKIDALSNQDLNAALAGFLDQQAAFKDCSQKELTIIQKIISEIIERAALLTAVNISAAIIKASRVKKDKKYCISADGSVYYKLHSFRERAERYLHEIMKQYKLDFTIVKVDDAPILGAAVAGFSS
jgi:hexokinase